MMISKKHMKNKRILRERRGFVATIAVIMLAYSILAIVAITVALAKTYLDNVYLYESRVEARQNLFACLDIAESRLASNYFLRGHFGLREFNCEFFVLENGMQGSSGSILLNAIVKIGPVIMKGGETVELHDYYMKVIERMVED